MKYSNVIICSKTNFVQKVDFSLVVVTVVEVEGSYPTFDIPKVKQRDALQEL